MTATCYLDDLLVMGKTKTFVNDIRSKLSESLNLKDLGILLHYLAIENDWSVKGEVLLSLQTLITKLLIQTGMSDPKRIKSPQVIGVKHNVEINQ